MTKIVIVEDDEITAQHLKFCLNKQGYDVVAIASNTLKARTKIKVHKPDVVLLDISLEEPDEGIAFAHVLREEFALPFIYLSSHSDASYIQKAQETKPYGYLVKPFEPNTLHTTIQMALAKFHESIEDKNALLKVRNEKLELEKLFGHTQEATPVVHEFGQGYKFYPQSLELFYEEKRIELTHNERLAIHLLLSHIGRVVNMDALINYIWEDEGATHNSVRTLLWRLRSKLPTPIIDNSSRQGYLIKA